MQSLDVPFSPLRLSLRQWQVFVAVARVGSTAAAGDAVALSQSAASAALNQLERVLDERVFDRVGKRLLLNAAGAALLPRAQALLDAAAEIEQMARNPHPAALRIGASTTIGNYVLPQFLAHLMALPAEGSAAPGSTPSVPSIRIGNTGLMCAALADFALDVALVEGPAQHPHLRARTWMDDELVIVAPPGFPARHVSVAQLKATPWLLREEGSGTRTVTDHWLLPHLVQYQRRLELGSSEAIVGAVAAGLGIACLSAQVVASALALGTVCQLATPLPPMRRRYHLLIHRHRQPTRVLERFLALARDWARPAAGRRKPHRPVPVR